jgi:tRNA nucleotidyltransferase (CCA-adding enzyme)
MGMKNIKPTPQERKKDLELAEKIIQEIKKQGFDSMLVGSIAKDTYLHGDKDLDVFVLFPKSFSRKKLEKKGLEIGEKVCKSLGVKPVVHYAEHPYTKTVFKGYDVDLVPCYSLKPGEKIISAVDRSPLHTEFIQNHLTPKQCNDVRKLKYFMKQIGVYGANIRVRGFSGYLCELLVLHYGSFEKVLKAAAKWRPGVFIDFEKHGSKQFEDPLTVIDPVDPERNVAAALTEQNYCWFILASRHFLKHKKIPKKTKLRKERGKFFVVEWKIKKEVEEIIWSQLERFQEKVDKLMEKHEFLVIDSQVWTDSEKTAQLLLEMEVWRLPKTNDHRGPPVYEKQRTRNFIEKYGKALVKGNRVVTEKKRDFHHAEDLLRELLKETPSHLTRNWKIKTGESVKKTRVFKEYSKKFWKLY